MRYRFFQINILVFVMLVFLISGVTVQAGDRVEKAGDVLTVALPVAAAGMMLGLKDGQGAIQFGESAALSLGVAYGLKYTIDAKRPNGDDHSFPSTHASASFMSAEFMRKRYGWEYGIPAYVAATFVAYSPVHAEEHYTRDVIAGAAIGIGSSYLFTRPYSGWHIQAEADHAYYGIRLSRSW